MLFSHTWTTQKIKIFFRTCRLLSVKTWNSWTKSTRSQRRFYFKLHSRSRLDSLRSVLLLMNPLTCPDGSEYNPQTYSTFTPMTAINCSIGPYTHSPYPIPKPYLNH